MADIANPYEPPVLGARPVARHDGESPLGQAMMIQQPVKILARRSRCRCPCESQASDEVAHLVARQLLQRPLRCQGQRHPVPCWPATHDERCNVKLVSERHEVIRLLVHLQVHVAHGPTLVWLRSRRARHSLAHTSEGKCSNLSTTDVASSAVRHQLRVCDEQPSPVFRNRCRRDYSI